ncbi:MAG: hypothetical protein C4345_00615 [Chloroflexota bacterium]
MGFWSNTWISAGDEPGLGDGACRVRAGEAVTAARGVGDPCAMHPVSAAARIEMAMAWAVRFFPTTTDRHVEYLTDRMTMFAFTLTLA